MDSKDKKNKDEKINAHKLMEAGGIVVDVDDSKEGMPPSATELEKQLRDGGIDVVEGKNLPEENN
ncbi:MAG: hypothetical protein Q7S11_03615 [bacterium]|nr:hypothetical protein [bacterium]